MCDTCGCSESGDTVTFRRPGKETAGEKHLHHGHGPGHDHGPGHHHHHHHDEGRKRTIRLVQDVLTKNNRIAGQNREYFQARNILALNLVSSPGSGKTTILEKTLAGLRDLPMAVIEGDQQTMRDAERIEAAGAPVIQVNTGTGCHLDAEMVRRAVDRLGVAENSVLFIENVGNLVCPALFDLGEAYKVVIISVTEGEDKPWKYPTMFQAADICIINKTDLLPYVDFDVSRCKEYACQVNNRLSFFELSATKGQGLGPWLDWLRRQFG